jgi:hypothetical protein
MGPAINISFNFGGGRYQTHQQHPLGGPTSTSSTTSVVAAARSGGSTPRGPPSISPLTSVVAAVRPTGSTPWGPAIDVFYNFDGGRCWTRRQHPQGDYHRCPLQLHWWPLPDLPVALPRGPLSTSFTTSVVDAAGPTGSTLREPAIDISFTFSGGRFWTHR